MICVLKTTLDVACKINCRRLRTEARDLLESTTVVCAMDGQGLDGGSRDREK